MCNFMLSFCFCSYMQLILWVPPGNELCVYNGLKFSSGRILKSTCPVQTVFPGPVSTHTGGISTVCLNVKMTRLKLKQECRFLWNNKTDMSLKHLLSNFILTPSQRIF